METVVPAGEPIISVLTATLDCVDQIQGCIETVAGQRDVAVEHIIIDGGSTDGTVEVIKDAVSGPGSTVGWWTSEPDQGVYDAWNKAIGHLRGQWVYCLGADDRLVDSDTLRKAAQRLAELPDSILLAYGQVQRVSLAGRTVEQWGQPYDIARDGFFKRAEYGTSIPHQGTFVRRETFERLGGFDRSYRVSGDTEFIARVLSASPEAAYLDICVARMASGGLSGAFKTVAVGWRENVRLGRLHRIPRARFRRWLKWLEWQAKILLFSHLPERWAAWVGDVGRRLRGRPAYWTKYSDQ
jgi:glycosyltransferase involved in cell wall biosynthesis